jgi:hypothetical protein
LREIGNYFFFVIFDWVYLAYLMIFCYKTRNFF